MNASDEKDHKRTAREMLKMVKAINGEYLAALGEDHAVQVECVTCHRGVSEPRLTLSEFARARFAAGKPNQARAALEILVDEHPDSLMGHFMLGEIDRIEGNVDAARAHFQRALEIDPQADWVRQQLQALDS